MLVLARRVGEEIVITLPSGEEITMIVSRIVQGTVKIGINAPDHIRVDRREVVDIRKKESKDPSFIPMRKSSPQNR